MSGMMRAITIGVVNHFDSEISCYSKKEGDERLAAELSKDVPLLA